MRTTKLAIIGLTATALTMGAAAAGTATAASSDTVLSASNDAASDTYVNGVQLPEADGGPLAVDRQDGEHVFAKGPSGWDYLTLFTGDVAFSRVTTDYPDDLNNVDGDNVFLTRSADGNDIDVVVATCDAVKVFQMPASQRTAPPLASIPTSFADSCLSDEFDDPYPVAPLGIVSLSDGRVAVLFNLDPTGADEDDAVTVFVGRPGGRFTRTVLARGFLTAITSDIRGDHAYVATQAGGGVVLFTFDTARSTWTHTNVSAVRTDYAANGIRSIGLTSISASHGQIWIAFGAATDDNAGAVVIIRRNANGRWESPRALADGYYPRLAVSPISPTAETWEVNEGPIAAREYLGPGQWTDDSTSLSPDASRILALTVNWEGDPVVEFISSTPPLPYE